MENIFSDRKGLYSFLMIFILFVLMIVCAQVSIALFKLTAPSLFGIADINAFTDSTAAQLKNPAAMIYFQALGSSIGGFLLPVLIYHFIFRYDLVSRMGIKILPPLRFWFIALVITFVGGIFIQVLVQINSAIPLYGKWQELRSMQQEVDKILDTFFSDTSFSRFLVLVFVMAVLPAVCEEFFFRGTIQNILSQTNVGPIGGIIIAGLTFSMVHFEFDNFLAIWCMGIMLGFVYYYSGSIWVSISAHFFNNFAVVAGKYAYMKGFIHSDVTGSDVLPLYITLPSGLLMIGGLVLMRKWSGKRAIVSY